LWSGAMARMWRHAREVALRGRGGGYAGRRSHARAVAFGKRAVASRHASARSIRRLGTQDSAPRRPLKMRRRASEPEMTAILD
jgi:hypothetical protein